MNSKSNLLYALAAVTSLTLGLGISFWRAATEANELRRAHHTAEMALFAAQDEMKVLYGRLARENKAREHALAAQAAAERSERMARGKLEQETAAHQATEDAKAKLESALQTAAVQIEQTEESRQSIETAWQSAEYAEIMVTARLNDEISARKAAEEALASAEDQVRLLNAKLAPGTPAKEKPQAGGTNGAVVAPVAGAEEKGAEKPARTSQLVPAAVKNRIVRVRKAGQPTGAIH